MNAAEAVRLSYERRPYPLGNAKALAGSTWNLDLKWVSAFGRPEAPENSGSRVLVAGCGAGTEAFTMQRLMPAAEIVAVDFSARSISIAKRLQRRSPQMRGILFVKADLTDRRLPARLGKFDLITCHGVLAYVPRLVAAMGNLGRCLGPGGVLYIGVNGASHSSARIRPALQRFGYGLDTYSGGRRLGAILRLCDTVLGCDGLPQVSGFGAAYLSSDVFGPLNRCLTLAGWLTHAREAGLHFRGSMASARRFRRIADAGLYPLLMPRSRAQVCEILDHLSPAPFHQLIFSGTPESSPPWAERGKLSRRRISLTRLYDVSLPKPRGVVRDRLRRVRITSIPRNASMEWRMPEWEVELLRCASGEHSLASLLRRIPLSVPFPELSRQLFLLYQLGVINLLPPREDQ